MEVLHEVPIASAFRPLPEFESQTPESFYSGPPVLHYQAPARLMVSTADSRSSPALSKLVDARAPEQTLQNGDHEQECTEELLTIDIDIWVTSEKLILYRTAHSTGVSIPYLEISVHAVQRLKDPLTQAEIQAVFLQITTSGGFDDHDPEETLSLSLIPAAREGVSSNAIHPTEVHISGPESSTPVSALFGAISACSSLHPDPASPSSSVNVDGEAGAAGGDTGPWQALPLEGLPPPMPGSGGWITAENMDHFFDADSNWRGQGLGPGAGIIRPRQDSPHGNGDTSMEDGVEETKWRKTDE